MAKKNRGDGILSKMIDERIKRRIPKSGKKRAPLRWYGGKGNLVKHIVPLLPRAKVYVEPFCGAASVFWRMKPYPIEVLNDLDENLITTFRVFQDPEKFELLAHRLLWTPYSLSEFRKALAILEDKEANDIDRAWAMFVGHCQGFSGKCDTQGDWGRGITFSGGRGHVWDRWQTRLGMIDWWHNRLANVQIDCRDALEVVKYWDTSDTVFYLDPPYVYGTRVKGFRDGIYFNEMTDEDHSRLVEILLGIKGKALLSGYANPIYERLEKAGWERKDISTVCHAAGRVRGSGLRGKGTARQKVPRVESIWISPDCKRRRIFNGFGIGKGPANDNGK